MQILAIDTSTDSCSVAIWKKGKHFARFENCYRKHNQRILSLVKEILDQSKTSLTDLKVLAFSRGPGSFTGIRMCISVAQGLALGANLPVLGVSTLMTMAQGAFRQIGATRVLSALDARMGNVYWSEYTRDKEGNWYGLETETVYTSTEVHARLKMLSGKWVTVGTGWSNIKPDISQQNSDKLKLINCNILMPSAIDMLPVIFQLLKTEKSIAVEHAEPVYLRNKVAKLFA